MGSGPPRSSAPCSPPSRAGPSCGVVTGNHSLVCPETAGSTAGRGHLERALDELGLQVPTRDLPHRFDGIGTIDHIAVPREVAVVGATRVSAVGVEGALSDHDAYVVAM